MRKPLALVLAVVAVLAVAGLPARALTPLPNTFTWTETWFPSQDGTMLRADVLLPTARHVGQDHPVILSIGPYFGRNPLNFPRENPTQPGPVTRFSDLWNQGQIFSRGYAYVQVDSRGYGGSDGCNDFGGPGEQSDAEAAVNWAARQPWSNGNVGMWGKSYDAWTQVMALSENPVGLKAAVIQSPLLDTYHGMFMNGVHYALGWYGTPANYAGWDLAPTTASDARPEEFVYPAKGTLTNPHCYALNLSMTTQPDRSLPYWKQRELIPTARLSRVPVLWSHGFNDENTKSDNFIPVYSKLQGPKRAWFGQYDHVRGNQSSLVGRKGFMNEAMDFFDHYLKGEPLVEHPAVEVQNGEGWWRTEESWPPADALRKTMSLRAGGYRDDVRTEGAALGEDTLWTFTQPAPYNVHFAGEPILEATVTPEVPNANLIAVLYDIDANGDGRRVTRGAYRITTTGSIWFRLQPQDWLLRKGHRFGIALSGDDPLFMPTPTGGRVAVTKASLSLPFLRWHRTVNLEGGDARAMQDVQTIEVTEAMIAANRVTVTFPPRLEERS